MSEIAIDKTDQAIEQLRDQLLRPMALQFGFPLSKRTGQTTSVPTVLCLGNHSSGKSSFINHWIGQQVQHTGVAPTDDGFTVLMYGDGQVDIDGRIAVVDPQLLLRDFEQYGKEFLNHLKVKKLPLNPLKKLCLIDSPGMIDHVGPVGDYSRGYDFPAVVREFANHADLIIFFFDPNNPGTTEESLRIFSEALSDVGYKLRIVFNKVDTFADVRDFARTYGALCWNLSRIARTKDMPHIYCTYIEELAINRHSQIDLVDFLRSTEELKQQVSDVPSLRRSNVIGAVLDAARCLRLHATICQHVGMRLMVARLGLWLLGGLMAAVSVWLLLYHRSQTVWIVTAVTLLLTGIGLWIGSRGLLRKLLQRYVSRLDALFHDLFHRELLEQSHSRFLEGLWESVKPKTIKFLQTVGPSGIPYSPLWRSRIRKLRRAADNEIPQILNRVQQEKTKA